MKKWFPILVSVLLILSLTLSACGQITPTTAPTTSAAPAAGQPSAPPPTSSVVSSSAPASIPQTATAAAQSKAIKLTYNNFFPPTHNNSILAEMWINEIQKRTNGAVTFSYLPGASLTASNKVYDGVVSGISDIGFSVVAYTPGRFSATELIDLPHAYACGYVATMVSNDFYKQFKPAEFKDVQVFYFYATGPQVLFTTKKQVSKLEDLKGMVLRSTGIGAGSLRLCSCSK
jgi:TRAP-type C4-dicarboxylate transport system substrate-binding protein